VFAVVAENDVDVPPKEKGRPMRQAAAPGGAPATIVSLPHTDHWQPIAGAYAGSFAYPPQLFAGWALAGWYEDAVAQRRGDTEPHS